MLKNAGFVTVHHIYANCSRHVHEIFTLLDTMTPADRRVIVSVVNAEFTEKIPPAVGEDNGDVRDFGILPEFSIFAESHRTGESTKGEGGEESAGR